MSREQRAIGLSAVFVNADAMDIPIVVSAALGVFDGDRYRIDRESSLVAIVAPGTAEEEDAKILCAGLEVVPQFERFPTELRNTLFRWSQQHNFDALPHVVSDERIEGSILSMGLRLLRLSPVTMPLFELGRREIEDIAWDPSYGRLGLFGSAIQESRVNALRYLDLPDRAVPVE